MKVQVKCDKCQGTGVLPRYGHCPSNHTLHGTQLCRWCHGTGKVVKDAIEHTSEDRQTTLPGVKR